MRHRPTRRGDPSSDLATAAPKSFLHEYRHVSYWLARNDRGMWRWSLAGETTGGAAFYTREQAEAAAKHYIDCLHELMPMLEAVKSVIEDFKEGTDDRQEKD